MLRSLERYKLAAGLAGIGGSIFLGVIGFFVIHLLVFGELLREIPVGTKPSTTPVVLKGGARVQLSLHVSRLASGSCDLMTVETATFRTADLSFRRRAGPRSNARIRQRALPRR